MNESASPFPVGELESQLGAVHRYWKSLIRGDNNMPFWDDFAPSAIPEVAGGLVLLDVFTKPLRFRFSGIVGADVEKKYGEEIRGLFADEIPARGPLDYLSSQADATVEGAKPTYYRGADYSRLLAPMWGDGKIGMLLGAIVWR